MTEVEKKARSDVYDLIQEQINKPQRRLDERRKRDEKIIPTRKGDK